ncbi:hypothetical protein HMPREF1557_02238 [Streptococcus sobrinus W1703]|uniref:Uncharacterized protein n=1 Tax=Streptococcus sobrinus W1703 TaxID=1227275 RepID=U2IIE5_9STRE|nr:hypothetical protein HMPREF1557_02238 [Streptococcus sobrinus W1703]
MLFTICLKSFNAFCFKFIFRIHASHLFMLSTIFLMSKHPAGWLGVIIILVIE